MGSGSPKEWPVAWSDITLKKILEGVFGEYLGYRGENLEEIHEIRVCMVEKGLYGETGEFQKRFPATNDYIDKYIEFGIKSGEYPYSDDDLLYAVDKSGRICKIRNYNSNKFCDVESTVNFFNEEGKMLQGYEPSKDNLEDKSFDYYKYDYMNELDHLITYYISQIVKGKRPLIDYFVNWEPGLFICALEAVTKLPPPKGNLASEKLCKAKEIIKSWEKYNSFKDSFKKDIRNILKKQCSDN
jgi:hypothetical protein